MLCRIQIQGVSKQILTDIIWFLSKLDEKSFQKSTKKEMTEKIWLEKSRKNLEKKNENDLFLGSCKNSLKRKQIDRGELKVLRGRGMARLHLINCRLISSIKIIRK